MEYTEYQKRTIKRIVDSYMRMDASADMSKTAKRFLLADEVGLGKTIVAKGVIRCMMCKLLKKELDELPEEKAQEKTETREEVIKSMRAGNRYYYFHVLYMCANTNIAKQNEVKLGLRETEEKTVKQSRAEWTNRSSCLSRKIFDIGVGYKRDDSGQIQKKVEVKQVPSLDVSFRQVLDDYGEIYGKDDGIYEYLNKIVNENFAARLIILPITPKISGKIKGKGNKDERQYIQNLINAFEKYDEILKKVELIKDNNSSEEKKQWKELFPDSEQGDYGATGAKVQFEELKEYYQISYAPIKRNKSIKECESNAFTNDADNNAWETVRENISDITLKWLKPELIIYDEFQNFREIMTEYTASQKLDSQEPYALMLSATPFRMYLSDNQAEQDEKNADLTKVCEFLMQKQDENPSELSDSLKEYKSALEDFSKSSGISERTVLEKKKAFESKMSQVFSRMERINVLRNLDLPVQDAGQRTEYPCGKVPQLYEYAKELHDYAIGGTDNQKVEYAKRMPYMFSFMTAKGSSKGIQEIQEGYRLKRAFDDKVKTGDIKAIADAKSYVLKDDFDDLTKALGNWHGVYLETLLQVLDFTDENVKKWAKELGCAEDEIRENHPGASRLLWIPSVVNQESLQGAFSEHRGYGKTIMFADRVAVPRMMAGLISREVERRLLWLIWQKQKNKQEVVSAGIEQGEFIKNLKAVQEKVQKLANKRNAEETLARKQKNTIFFTSSIGMYAVWATLGLREFVARAALGHPDSVSKDVETVLGDEVQANSLYEECKEQIKEYCTYGLYETVLAEWMYMNDTEDLNKVSEILFPSHRSTKIEISLYTKDSGAGITQEKRKIDTYYARCIGLSKDDDKVSTIDNLQKAFNSPFAPFVFATTSVGQEGLDFHHYADRIVHLAIPANPTAFEQREGRINRRNCLAIRRKVIEWYGDRNNGNSETYGQEAERNEVVKYVKQTLDGAFQNAENQILGSVSKDSKSGLKDSILKCGMIPHWLLVRKIESVSEKNGDSCYELAGIRRIVPYFYATKMMTQYHNMLKTLQLYRSVIGQADPEELLERLMVQHSKEEIENLFVDFSPYSSDISGAL